MYIRNAGMRAWPAAVYAELALILFLVRTRRGLIKYSDTYDNEQRSDSRSENRPYDEFPSRTPFHFLIIYTNAKTALGRFLHSGNVNAPRTLATTYSPLASTIGSRELNFRVRNGNGCGLSDKSPAFWARCTCQKTNTH
jgi:hypothetical protein